jgi:hypothetical protein
MIETNTRTYTFGTTGVSFAVTANNDGNILTIDSPIWEESFKGRPIGTFEKRLREKHGEFTIQSNIITPVNDREALLTAMLDACIDALPPGKHPVFACPKCGRDRLVKKILRRCVCERGNGDGGEMNAGKED